jgi:hypothetical protein
MARPNLAGTDDPTAGRISSALDEVILQLFDYPQRAVARVNH